MTNPAVLTIYNKVVKMCNECDIDLYLYVNNEDVEYEVFDNTIYFSYDYLKQKYNYNITFLHHKPFHGLMNLPLIDLYRNHNEYDNYIFYEDDVLYQGDKNLFTLFDYSYDMVFQDERQYNVIWYWYLNMNNYYGNIKNEYLPYSGLLNIFAVSNKFLNEYYNFLKETGLMAFHEYSINSFTINRANKNILTYTALPNSLSKNMEYKSDLLKHGNHYNIVHPIKTLKDLKLYSIDG